MWSSKRQTIVSRSSTESEYKSLSNDAQESVHLSRLLNELPISSELRVPIHCLSTTALNDLSKASVPTSQDTHMFCNNSRAIKLAKNPVFHACSKHIEISHHYVQERVLSGEISLEYIPTNDQPADILTKPLGRTKFEQHKDNIGIVSRLTLGVE